MQAVLKIMARLKNGNAFVTRRMQDVNQNLIQFIRFIRRIANNRTGASVRSSPRFVVTRIRRRSKRTKTTQHTTN